VSVRCGTCHERLPRYLDDALPADERRAFREHLASCEDCRGEIAAIEPSLLFARIASEPVSSEDVASVLAGVHAGIALAETERKVEGAIGRRRRRAAAIVSAAVLAAMTLVLPGSARRPVAPVATAPSTPAPAPGFAPAARREPSGTFPADATIYDWNPGASSRGPRVVWIVDRSLDI
jgi:anti-sigma factor RsiW